MDEYAQYLYDHRPHYRNIDPGDLTEQRKVREKLKCKPFKWFMEEVAFDLVKVYPPVEPPPFASGEVFFMNNVIYSKSGQTVLTQIRQSDQNLQCLNFF